jgi:TRAP-type C4-dicarboxylate transport system substrate-binding protein
MKVIGKWAILISISLVFVFPCQTVAAEEKFVWRHQSCIPAGDDRYEIGDAKVFPEIIKKRTNGRLELTVYPAGALCPVPQMLDSAGAGMFDSMLACGAYWQGALPVGGPETGLPMSFRNNDDIYNIFWDLGAEDLMKKVYARHNVYYLTVLAMGGGGVSTKKPIQKIEDYKGLKIRGVGSYMDFLAKLGASPVFLPMDEIYMAVSLGTVDGLFTAWTSQVGLKLYEVTTHMALPELYPTYTNHILVNMNSWKKLPKDLQQTVQAAAREYSHWFSRWNAQDSEKSRNMLVEKGVKPIEIRKSDLEIMDKAAQEVWDEYAAKSEASAQLISTYRKYFDKTK